MAAIPVQPGRVRAWIFGYVDPQVGITKILQTNFPHPSGWADKKFFEIGDDDYVIVRADEVVQFLFNGEKCNLVIPVDAKDDTQLDIARNVITNDLHIAYVAEVRVANHNPWPPHKAHGYITLEEFITFKDEHVGRQFHNSPGSNKWG